MIILRTILTIPLKMPDKDTMETAIRLAAMDPSRHHGRATEEQKRQARELDISFPEDISEEALGELIAWRPCQLDPPPDWLKQVAAHLGLGNARSTRRELIHLVEAELMIAGRELDLMVWFLYGVSRHITGADWDGPDDSGITTETMEKLATRLVREPWVMASLKRYLPGTLYRFGNLYGSTDTLAFRVAAKVLEEETDVVCACDTAENKPRRFMDKR